MRELITALRREYDLIFHDTGVMLILVFAPLIYGVIYSLTYAPQVLRQVPIGVVDMSRTPSSRELCRLLTASPDLEIGYEPADMVEAERLFYAGQIHGILYIPSDYERQLLRGEQAVVAAYLDASYMLMYREVYKAVVEVIKELSSTVELRRLTMQGVAPSLVNKLVHPVEYRQHTTFNPTLGYGSFVMPPVLILILQQTMLVGIGMIGSTRAERRRVEILPRRSIIVSIVGRALAYASIYSVVMLYLFDLHYRIFDYPMLGRGWEVALFLMIYLFACIFAGMALSLLFRRRESSLMVLLWSSIPLLMLSGASFPDEAMPMVFRWLSAVFPSTFGVQGFVQMQTAGATIWEVGPQVRSLAVLMVIYFVVVCVGEWMMAKRQGVSNISDNGGKSNEKIFS